MGIKNLNRFILDNCKRQTVCKKSLKYFENKTVVIDTSIYMYKYVAQNALIENFYFMMTLFKEYKITPLFVFDGKPPPEKRELLKERSELKRTAEAKYNEIKADIEKNNNMTNEMKNELVIEMDCLKTQFVRLNWSDIQTVKQLIQSYGLVYYNASGESDRLCVEMVMTGKAWACLSDDMDMLVYGCPRVMRHLSLMNCNVVFYDLKPILAELDMDMKTFRQIAVISGTDYNLSRNTIVHSLHETMCWYNEYIKRRSNIQNSSLKPDFYEWLNVNTKYISNLSELYKIYDMFCIDNPNIDNIANYASVYLPDPNKLNDMLAKDGFIFV